MLKYKLLLTVKDLSRVITDDISNRLMEIFDYIAPNYKITRLEWEHGEHCIEVVFKAHPITELSKFINAYKSAGSRLIKKEYPEILIYLNNGQFWSKSFCLLTIGEEIEDIIRDYLQKQGSVIHKKPSVSNTKEGKHL